MLLTRTLACLAVLAVAGAFAAPPARAETLQDALKRQALLKKLVEDWIRLAERDPAEDDVEKYSRQQELDWTKKDRVQAKTLAAIIANPKHDKGLRERAAKELERGAVSTNDPDLSADKRGEKRKSFTRKEILPLIKRSDEDGCDMLGRKLAYNLLLLWFPPGPKDQSEVANYDPASAKEDTWGPAHRAFRDALNK